MSFYRVVPSAPDHPSLRFYDNDRSLARLVAGFLREGFEDGSPAIVIATERQRAEIILELAAQAVDALVLQASGDLVLLDADEILSTIMVDGQPDGRKFSEAVHRLLETARRGRDKGPVRLFAQMIDLLWQRGDRSAAIRLELLWNELARTEVSSVVCGYAIGNFYKDTRFGEGACGQAHPAAAAPHRVRRRSTRRKPR